MRLLCLMTAIAPLLAVDPVTVTFDTPGTVVGGHPLGYGPGASGIVLSIADDLVRLQSDLRGANNLQTDHANWFWFYARIHAGGRPSVRIAVNSISNGMTARGPAVSFDNGATWAWNGSTTIAMPPGVENVLVALAPPYTDSQWQAFLTRLGGNAPRTRTLTTSNRGRPVPLAEYGPASGATHRVLVCARTHAMEVTGSLVLEGFLETVATDPVWASRLGHTLVQAVPFVDRDGVELGEQGKGRTPRDHNGDFGSTSRIYAETRAIIALNENTAQPAMTVDLDIHAPWIEGGANETIFSLVPTDTGLRPRYLAFVNDIAAINLAATWPTTTYDTSANQDSTSTSTSSHVGYFRWGPKRAEISQTYEVPFSQNYGQEVTWAKLRGFGRSLALATANRIPAGTVNQRPVISTPAAGVPATLALP
jgi:hypothetical protein